MATMPKTVSSESKAEQVMRVRQMAGDTGDTWDLSLNDQAALQAVLDDRDALLAAVKALVQIVAEHNAQDLDWDHAVAAIANAEAA